MSKIYSKYIVAYDEYDKYKLIHQSKRNIITFAVNHDIDILTLNEEFAARTKINIEYA